MTRRKWTTDEQEEWLEQRKPAFLEANQKKTAAKDFFPTVVEEFRQKWPVPPVTEQEIADAGSVELAKRVKQNKYDKVNNSCACSQGKRWLTDEHSAHQGGFPIIRES
jgi:predicted nucleic acid-binding protein